MIQTPFNNLIWFPWCPWRVVLLWFFSQGTWHMFCIDTSIAIPHGIRHIPRLDHSAQPSAHSTSLWSPRPVDGSWTSIHLAIILDSCHLGRNIRTEYQHDHMMLWAKHYINCCPHPCQVLFDSWTLIKMNYNFKITKSPNFLRGWPEVGSRLVAFFEISLNLFKSL